MAVRTRHVLSALLIASGVLLCGLAARHYVRGWQAQKEGRQTLQRRLTGHSGENPGVVPARRLEGASADPDLPGSAEGIPPGYPYGEPIAHLTISAARIDVIVFGGADQKTLERGPGHVPGTELPGVRTSLGNCVITGHRDSHFRNLGWLKPGHEIALETPSGTVRYRVVSREIVAPDATRVLQPTAHPRLTLITCYPFNFVGPAPKRLVVVAEPV
jgi:sortase A